MDVEKLIVEVQNADINAEAQGKIVRILKMFSTSGVFESEVIPKEFIKGKEVIETSLETDVRNIDIAKTTIKVEWHGETMERTDERAWWHELATEEIVNEIVLAIDRIGEE